jgi:hypothetical protein
MRVGILDVLTIPEGYYYIGASAGVYLSTPE